MKPSGICVVLVFIFSTPLFSQGIDSTKKAKPDSLKFWKTKVKFAINLNQASFSSNWKGGGVNSIGMTSMFGFKANYKRKRNTWDNEIDLGYGFVDNSGQGFRKTLDRIYLDTKFGTQLNKKWGTYTSLNFSSQFADGFKYEKDPSGVEQARLVSDIFAPAFITSSWGAEYHPNSYFKLRISPFSPRITIVRNAERYVATVGEKPYGVEPAQNTRLEWLSFQMTADFNKEIMENITLAWKYLLFINYENFKWKQYDHRLDLMITAKVNKFIQTSVGGILLYDFDQDANVQLSQTFGLGFLYTFQNYKEEKKEKK